MISLNASRSTPEANDYKLIGLAQSEKVITPSESLKTTFTLDIHQPMATIERDIIEAVISSCNGSIPKASTILQLSPSTIYRKREAWQQLQEDAQVSANLSA